MYSTEEVTVPDVAVTRALALRARIPTDGGVLLFTVALHESLFLVSFAVIWSELFLPLPFFWSAVPT
jgi:hypothetical protein